MVLISSYLIASIFEIKKFKTGLMYLYLIMFAQVVFTIEFLSLFKSISQIGILVLNTLVLAGTIFFWQKKGKPLYKPQFKQYFIKVFNAIKKDKMLGVMGIGFLFFIGITIFLCALVPVMEYDSLSYHFNRAIIWTTQKSLAHFDIADDRNINMAINSEILYTWFLTFVPKNWFIRFFTFTDYIFALIALSSFLEINNFSMRKRLWTAFLFTAIGGITVGASGVETNIMIGALALAGTSLFQIGMKKSLVSPIYFSALAFALAVGAKTSIFFLLPAIALILLFFIFKYQRQNAAKYLLIFTGFSFLNFVLFASYNYVLNFIEFGNVMGTAGSISYHQMVGGIKGYISGLIRHLVLLLDFSGFSYAFYLEKAVFAAQIKALNFMHIPLDLNVISSNQGRLNISLNDSVVGGGVIGTFILLPCAIIAILKAVFCKKSDRNKLFALLAISIFISIAVMSACIGFMKFSSRFIFSFLIFASPLLTISYIKSNKNIFKYLILFYVLSYFMVISTHISPRHFFNIIERLKHGTSISKMRNTCLCSTSTGFSGEMSFCALRKELYKLPKGSHIGLFSDFSNNTAIINLMNFDGYKIDILLHEKLHTYDLKNYDYLVFSSDKIMSSLIYNPQEILKNYYIKDKKVQFVDPNKATCLLTDNNQILVTNENIKNTVPTKLNCVIPYEILYKNGFYKITQIIEKDNVEKKISIFKR